MRKHVGGKRDQGKIPVVKINSIIPYSGACRLPEGRPMGLAARIGRAESLADVYARGGAIVNAIPK